MLTRGRKRAPNLRGAGRRSDLSLVRCQDESSRPCSKTFSTSGLLTQEQLVAAQVLKKNSRTPRACVRLAVELTPRAFNVLSSPTQALAVRFEARGRIRHC